jgi:hypothetical protein
MRVATLKISKADQELLTTLGYNPGAAIREFCNLKRRTNLSSLVKKEDIEKRIKEEEALQRASKAREQDLLSQIAICEENEAENARIKGDITTCKTVTVNRLYDNRRIIQKRASGYLEKIDYCLSALPQGVLSREDIIDFFENFDKNPPKKGDIEFLVF